MLAQWLSMLRITSGLFEVTEKIGGDESELRGLDANDTNDRAVNGSNDPALPELLANEHSRQDGQNARDIIESNHVERIQHIGPMSRSEAKLDGIFSWRTYVYGSPS